MNSFDCMNPGFHKYYIEKKTAPNGEWNSIVFNCLSLVFVLCGFLYSFYLAKYLPMHPEKIVEREIQDCQTRVMQFIMEI